MKRFATLLSLVVLAFCCSQANAQALYRLPLSSNPGINAWFDHNNTTGSLLRYDCATSFQYDGHHGTDFNCSLNTSVFAGAIGSLYSVTDGCPDGSNPSCGGGFGNHVRIQSQRDGRVTIYAHLEAGTMIGPSSVTCGAFVGKTGNSGEATGPHLHFELWQDTSASARLDFFGGSCSSPSYWVNQNGSNPTTQCQ